MSKPSPVPSLAFAEQIVAELEAERIESLSREELHAEMRDLGLDPDTPVDIDKWIAAGVAERAAAEAKGVAEPAAPEAKAVAERASSEAKPPQDKVATVVPIRRRGPVAVALSITAVAAGFVGVILDRAVLDRGRGGDNPIAQHDAGPPPTASSPTPPILVRAAQLREEAERACLESLWHACETRLDEASVLDPDGEHEWRVQSMRRGIEFQKKIQKGPMTDTRMFPRSKP